MSYAICHLSIVPLRHSPSDKSEQVSQLLFGEMVELLEWKGKAWVKVRCTWDNVIAWAQARQVKPVTNTEHELFAERFAFCLDLSQPLLCDDHAMPVPMGARLPDFDGMKFTFDGNRYHYSGQAVFPEHLEPTSERVIKIARRYLLAPFLWGGRSPFGIDASGLSQMVFQMVGIRLHRLPEAQVHQGQLVDFMEEALPGDIAFFENQAGNISHVGILFPDGRIIHAAEQVRLDRIDHFGIFDEETQRYTHRLRVVKRVLDHTQTTTLQVKEKRTERPQPALF